MSTLDRDADADQVAPDWVLATRSRTDRDAFGQLYRSHRATIHGYIAHRVRQPETVEDLTHDVFVRALDGIDRVTYTGAPFTAWLVAIARNAVVDHYRSARTRRERLVDEIPEVHIPGQRTGLDAVEAAVVLHGALADLPDADRDILIGRYLHDLTWAEITALDGRSYLAVKQQGHRAIARVRRQLRLKAAS